MASSKEKGAEKRLQAILDTTVDGIVTMGADSRIQSFNKAAEKIFGYRAEEVLGRNVSILMPEPYRREHDSYVGRYLETGKAQIIGIGREVTGQRKDGTTFPLDLAVSETVVDGQRLFTGILRDISEKRQIEQQLRQAQKMDALGVLAGGIAHNFNNVLAGILGFIELALSESDPSSEQHAFLQEARAAAMHGKGMTEEILAMSRRRESQFKTLDLKPVLDESVQFIRGTLPSSVRISCSVEKELPAVWGDSSMFHQLLVNLYTNAYQAMDEYQGGTIAVEAAALAPGAKVLDRIFPSKAVCITVRDNGRGMDPATLQRIFEPFFTTKEEGGTGLGLATVHGAVTSMGGRITVESEAGRGTTFRIYLPMHSQQRHDAHPAAQGEPAARRQAESLKREVLFVDDEEALVRLGERALTRMGYSVTGLHSPLEALSLFEYDPTRFAVVVSDYTMPHMTGLELLERMHALRPDLPLILASGYSSRLTPESAKEHGISAYLAKPYHVEELAATVHAVLNTPKQAPYRC